MDFWDTLYQKPTTAEQQAAFASALRNQASLGGMLELSGDKVLTPAGKSMQGMSSKQAQQNINHQYYQGLLEESKRWHDMQADLGKQRMALARTLARTKGNTTKALPKNQMDVLLAEGQMIRGLSNIQKMYKPDWVSSFPGQGMLKMAIGKTRFAPQSWKEFQAWRGDIEQWVDAIIRHNLFGAALTATELENWKLQALHPDADAEQTAKLLNDLRNRIEPEYAKRAQALTRQYDPQQVEDLTMDIMPLLGEEMELGEE